MSSTDELARRLARNPFTRRLPHAVLASDQLPRGTPLFGECLLIVNDQPSYQNGNHWIAIYIPDDSGAPAEFFDSAGSHPDMYPEEIIDFITQSRSSYMYNTRRIQALSSVNCGYYCLFYLYNRVRGITMDYLMHYFTDDLAMNDKLVTLYVNQTL